MSVYSTVRPGDHLLRPESERKVGWGERPMSSAPVSACISHMKNIHISSCKTNIFRMYCWRQLYTFKIQSLCAPTWFNIQQLHFSLEFIFALLVTLTINVESTRERCSLVGVCEGDVLFLSWGRTWITVTYCLDELTTWDCWMPQVDVCERPTQLSCIRQFLCHF